MSGLNRYRSRRRIRGRIYKIGFANTNCERKRDSKATEFKKNKTTKDEEREGFSRLFFVFSASSWFYFS